MTLPFSADQVGSFVYRKNDVINGDFNIWQRGTSFTDAAAKVYTADRWQGYRAVFAANGTFSRQAASGLDQFLYCMRAQRDSGDPNTSILFLTNTFESKDSYRFQGQQATLSFWIRKGANFSGTVNCSIFGGTGVDDPFTSLSQLGATLPTPTASWVKYSLTVSVASSNTQLGIRFYYTPTGTAGTFEYFEITGVQLELGATETDFDFMNSETELARCQRYYEKSYGLSVVPGTVTNSGRVYDNSSRSSNAIALGCDFRVSKRITPTMIAYSPTTGSSGVARNGGSNRTASLVDIVESRAGYLNIPTGVAGAVIYQWTAEAEL